MTETPELFHRARLIEVLIPLWVDAHRDLLAAANRDARQRGWGAQIAIEDVVTALLGIDPAGVASEAIDDDGVHLSSALAERIIVWAREDEAEELGEEHRAALTEHDETIAEARAEAAALREGLEPLPDLLRPVLTNSDDPWDIHGLVEALATVRAALATDAGRRELERRRRLEAVASAAAALDRALTDVPYTGEDEEPAWQALTAALDALDAAGEDRQP